MENVDLNILGQWLNASFWNHIFITFFAIILSIQIIFLCGYEGKRFGNKKKTKTQEIISAENDNNKPVKVEPAPTAAPKPLQQQYDPPPLSLCPEDTLHDVTSIAMDNETTFYMLSPDFSKTALTHSVREIQKEMAQSPHQQTSTS